MFDDAPTGPTRSGDVVVRRCVQSHGPAYGSGVNVLVVANRGDGDPGYVGAHLAHGHRAQVHRAWREQPEDWPDPVTMDAVVLLGSDWSVYWDHVAEFVAAEAELVRRVHEARRPLLGICFGGQLVAHALGGRVERAPEHEVGWYDLEFESAYETASPGDAAMPWFERGPWFAWHVDRFEAPAPARVVARTPRAVQAFTWDRTCALQFHPAVTAEMVERWSSGDGEAELTRLGVDVATLRARSRDLAPTRAGAARALVDGWLERATR